MFHDFLAIGVEVATLSFYVINSLSSPYEMLAHLLETSALHCHPYPMLTSFGREPSVCPENLRDLLYLIQELSHYSLRKFRVVHPMRLSE